jgi:hypothetical protein
MQTFVGCRPPPAAMMMGRKRLSSMIQVLSVVFLFFQMSFIVPGAWMNFSAYNVDG